MASKRCYGQRKLQFVKVIFKKDYTATCNRAHGTFALNFLIRIVMHCFLSFFLICLASHANCYLLKKNLNYPGTFSD